jgi:hypothetical protein
MKTKLRIRSRAFIAWHFSTARSIPEFDHGPGGSHLTKTMPVGFAGGSSVNASVQRRISVPCPPFNCD